jgi:hypothetical protein
MEFLAGLLCLSLGFAAIAVALRRKGRWIDATFRAAICLEAMVLSTAAIDWGYSWVEETALHMALERNVWLLVPHAGALLVILSLVVWGRRAIPRALVLVVGQAASMVPVLYLVGLDLDMSFLAPAPLAALYGSALAAFLLVPAACSVVPRPSSRWHRITMAPRQSLIDAIEGLRSEGFATEPPESVLESGAARGAVDGAFVEVATPPRLVPLAYGLTVTVSPAPAAMPDLPRFASGESLRRVDGDLVYQATSPRDFDITSERLIGFIRAIAAPIPHP